MDEEQKGVVARIKTINEFFENLLRKHPDLELDLDGVVYYVLLDIGHWKIGRVESEHRLGARFSEFPEQYGFQAVQLMALERGGWLKEHFRHYQFQQSRIMAKGEQFFATPELRAHAKSMRDEADNGLKILMGDLDIAKANRKGGLKDGEIYATLSPPFGGVDWFFSSGTVEVMRQLDRAKNRGYRQSDVGVEFIYDKTSNMGKREVSTVVEYLLFLGATKV